MRLHPPQTTPNHTSQSSRCSENAQSPNCSPLPGSPAAGTVPSSPNQTPRSLPTRPSPPRTICDETVVLLSLARSLVLRWPSPLAVDSLFRPPTQRLSTRTRSTAAKTPREPARRHLPASSSTIHRLHSRGGTAVSRQRLTAIPGATPFFERPVVIPTLCARGDERRSSLSAAFCIAINLHALRVRPAARGSLTERAGAVCNLCYI